MTLIIGIRCRDGLVLAADSMSTESAPGGDGLSGLLTKHEAEKLVITNHLLWGASGAVGVKQQVEQAIQKSYGSIYNHKATGVSLRQNLVKAIQPVVKECYRATGETLPSARIPVTNFVFGTYLSEGFCLVSIEYDMKGEVIESKFFSTGSGAKTGQALLRRLRDHDWDVQTGLVVAYRTMSDAIHVEPFGIGEPIRLAKCVLGEDGKPLLTMVGEGELTTIRDAARAWLEVEREALAGLHAAAPATGTSPPPGA